MTQLLLYFYGIFNTFWSAGLAYIVQDFTMLLLKLRDTPDIIRLISSNAMQDDEDADLNEYFNNIYWASVIG